MVEGSTRDARLSVLQSVAPPDGTTRFVDQVTRFAPPSITFRFFSWRAALIGRWDVLHVHWPEFLLRGRNPLVGVVRTFLFSLLLLRLTASRKKVVRTLHNITPHDPGSRIETFLIRLLDRRTDLFVRLNDETAVPPEKASVLIPHGHYRDVLPREARHESRPGLLLFFGRIEAYKNVERLVGVFRGAADPGLELRIVGKASDELRQRISAAADGDERIGLRFGFVPDDEMVAEMTTAQVVVLPYTEMHNSGVLLVALSLGRPVLVPATPANLRLADEVGRQWIRFFEGELETADIVAAVLSTTDLPSDGPALDGRDWSVVGASYARAYQRAVGSPHSGDPSTRGMS